MSSSRLVKIGLLVLVLVGRAYFRASWRSAGSTHVAQATEGKKTYSNDDGSAERRYQKGLACLEDHDADGALSWFDKAIAADPEMGAAYLQRGRAHALKKNYGRAVQDFSEAIRLKPDNLESYLDRGQAYGAQHHLDNAIADFGTAIRLQPQEPGHFRERSRLYAEKKDFDRALADANAAIELAPDKAEGYTARGFVHQHRQDYERAIADYAQAVRINQTDAQAYNNLAWVCATCPEAKFRNGPRALGYARYICELSAGKEPGYFDTLAAAHAEVGEFADAIRCQKRALEAPESYQSKEDLEKARTRLQLYLAHQPFRDE